MPAAAPLVRWALPFALLGVEYVALSFLVDLPTAGSAMWLVGVIRLAVPVLIGAAAGAWMLARGSIRSALQEVARSLPPWRPWPALAAHLLAFAATAALAWRVLRQEAPPASAGQLAAVLGCAALATILALSSAAPLRWTCRLVAVGWRTEVVALGLGLLSWRAADAAESLWGLLSAGTIRSVGWLLRLGAGEALVDPAQALVGLDGFEVVVAPICSGVDGLGLVVLFQATWIALSRSRLHVARALALLPLGAAAALAANVARLAILIRVGASGREDLALGGLHSKLGWILFLGVALGSVALAERIPWIRRSQATSPVQDEGVPPAAAAHLAPLLGAIGAALVTDIWAAGPLDRLYAARVGAGLAVLLLVRRSLPRPSLSWSWPPVLLAAGACALWIAQPGGDGRALADGLARLGAGERWAWIAARLGGSCVAMPIVEELAFRGFLMPWLVSPDFQSVPARRWTWPAVLLSSLAFGAIHQRWLAGAVAGLAFAAARVYRGRLGDAVLAHALCNAGLAAAVLLGGRWDLWT